MKHTKKSLAALAATAGIRVIFKPETVIPDVDRP